MSLVRNRHRASPQSALRVRPPGPPGAGHPEGATRGACDVRGDHWGGGQSSWRGGQGLNPNSQRFVQPVVKAGIKVIQPGQVGLLRETPIRLNRLGPYSTLGHHLQACSGSLRATARSPPQPSRIAPCWPVGGLMAWRTASQIEGTQSSLSDLLLFELEEAPGIPMDDVGEVSSDVAALEHGLARMARGFPLCCRLLREFHDHPG